MREKTQEQIRAEIGMATRARDLDEIWTEIAQLKARCGVLEGEKTDDIVPTQSERWVVDEDLEGWWRVSPDGPGEVIADGLHKAPAVHVAYMHNAAIKRVQTKRETNHA